MPDKKQYDDELVQLLGSGELSNQQIAKRVGLSASQVNRIARGEDRLDLQPGINAAMRQTLKEAWKNGGRLAAESGEPLPRSTAQTAFDRYLAVELIAAGQLTLSQIAKRLGVHKNTAWRMATGRSHPELQPLISEAQRHYRDRARRIGSKWSVQIVMKQIQVGLKNNGWVGLRARQDLLDRFLGPEDEDNPLPATARRSAVTSRQGCAGQDGKPDDAPRRPLLPIRSMTELSPPLFAAVLKELGGADLTLEDYENYAAEHKDRTAVLKELGLPERGGEYAEAFAAAHGDGPFIPDCGTDPPGMMLPIRSMTELPLPLREAVLKELGGWDPADNDPLFADCNDSSAVASPATPVAGKKTGTKRPFVPCPAAPPQEEDAGKEQATAALQENDVAPAFAKASAGRQGKQEETRPPEEGCSRNKKRRRRRRLRRQRVNGRAPPQS